MDKKPNKQNTIEKEHKSYVGKPLWEKTHHLKEIILFQ